jgi:hypothetical protein
MPDVTAVGRYEIREVLGAGAFGTVYRAHDPQLDREVALKVLKPEALGSPQAVERFQREARAAARLHHPNIVAVYDAGAHGGGQYIAAAFVEGRPLSALLAGGPLDPRRAAALVAQLADALAYAHRRNVLHRDVKPANCLVDAEDRLYLADFGLAGWVEQEATRLTGQGTLLGTPAYMAPEQASGDLAQVGPAADLYGAGVVLYELLTGRVPFEGNAHVILYHILHSEPRPPSSLRPGLSPELEAICLRAMARAPAARYADGGALAAALRAWLASQPPLPAPTAGQADRPPAAPQAATTLAEPPATPARHTVSQVTADQAQPPRGAPRVHPWAAAAAVVALAVGLGAWALTKDRTLPPSGPPDDGKAEVKEAGGDGPKKRHEEKPTPPDTPQDRALFQGVWDEVSVPPTAFHKGAPAASFDRLPAFSAEAVARHQPDRADSDLRRAVRRARVALWAVSGRSGEAPAELLADIRQFARESRISAAGWFRSEVRVPKDEKDLKDQLFNDGRDLAPNLGALEDILAELDKAGPRREQETPRWQANHDYVRARLLAQIAYLYEYQSALGQMRKELPPRDPRTQGGWALAASPDMRGDAVGKKAAKAAVKLLDRLIADHKGTPWEVLAEREKALPLGLEWRAVP